MIADAATRFAGAMGRPLAPERRRRLGLTFASLLLVAFAFHYARTLYHAIPADRSPYVPWEMHRILAPAIAAGEAQVVFYGFPDQQIEWRGQMQLGARDCYYLEQMRRGATWARGPGDLAGVLDAHKPTLLIVSRLMSVRDLLSTDLPHRLDHRFVYSHQGFHVIGLDLRPLLEPTGGSGNDAAYVKGVSETSRSAWTFSVTPSVVGSARVAVRFRLAARSGTSPIRYVFQIKLPDGKLKRLDDQQATSVNGILEVSAFVEREMWSPGVASEMSVSLSGPDVSATLEEVRLVMLPKVPVESYPRR